MTDRLPTEAELELFNAEVLKIVDRARCLHERFGKMALNGQTEIKFSDYWEPHVLPHGLLAQTEAYVPKIGYTLMPTGAESEVEIMRAGNADGVTNLKDKKIYISSKLPDDRRFSTLVHEIGHAVIPPYDLATTDLSTPMGLELVTGILMKDDQVVMSYAEAAAEVFNYFVRRHLNMPTGMSELYMAMHFGIRQLMHVLVPVWHAKRDFLAFLNQTTADRQEAA